MSPKFKEVYVTEFIERCLDELGIESLEELSDDEREILFTELSEVLEPPDMRTTEEQAEDEDAKARRNM